MIVQGVSQQTPIIQKIPAKNGSLPIPLMREILIQSCTSPSILSKLRCLNKRVTALINDPSFGVDVLNRLKAPGGNVRPSIMIPLNEGFTPRSFAEAQALLADEWSLFNFISALWFEAPDDLNKIPVEWYFAVAKKKLSNSLLGYLDIKFLITNEKLSGPELRELGECAVRCSRWDIAEFIMGRGIDLSHLQLKIIKWPDFWSPYDVLRHVDKFYKMIDDGVVSPKAMIVKGGEKRPLLELAIAHDNNIELAKELLHRGCPQTFINTQGNLEWLLIRSDYSLNNEMKKLLLSSADSEQHLSEFKEILNDMLFEKVIEDPNSDVIKDFIRLGADINAVDWKLGMSILAARAYFHGLEGLEVLKEKGAKLVTEDPHSLRGLHRLVEKYPEDILRTLLKDVPPEHLSFTPEVFEMVIEELEHYSIETLQKWHAIGLPPIPRWI